MRKYNYYGKTKELSDDEVKSLPGSMKVKILGANKWDSAEDGGVRYYTGPEYNEDLEFMVSTMHPSHNVKTQMISKEEFKEKFGYSF